MTDVRRERRAARRRTLQLLVQRRLAVMRSAQPPERVPLVHASISSTLRMPTDS